jgi:uncharacterized protein (TIRG00374 family)
MSRKRLISLIFATLIGVLLIVLWLRTVDPGQLLQRMKGVKANYVLLSAAVYLSAYFVRSRRWNLLLSRYPGISQWHTWLYSMGGNWVNYMIPLRLGEVVKAWFVKRNHGVPMMKVFPSIFIDKTFDTIAIFFVIVMIPFLKVRLSTGFMVLLGALAVVFLVSLAVILFSAKRKHSVTKALKKLVAWLPLGLKTKLNGYIEMFVEGLNLFEHHWTRLILAILLTALGLALDGLYFFLLFHAFGIAYPFALVLFGYTLINLSYALPQPPAQLGSNEWMMIIIFSVGFGLTRHDASAIMAFAHVLTAFLMSGVGIFAIAVSGHQILKAVIRGDRINE